MSILITGGNLDSRLTEAKKYNAIELDISTVEEVRELQKLTSTGQAVVIKNAQNLTEQAQNALLKTLEETETTIVLLADNEDQLLPTVVSRCAIVQLRPERAKRVEGSHQTEEILSRIEDHDFSSGSKWAETVKDRGEAISSIDNLLIYLQEERPLEAKTARKLFKAKKYLLANTNVRLTLENLFLP